MLRRKPEGNPCLFALFIACAERPTAKEVYLQLLEAAAKPLPTLGDDLRVSMDCSSDRAQTKRVGRPPDSDATKPFGTKHRRSERFVDPDKRCGQKSVASAFHLNATHEFGSTL